MGIASAFDDLEFLERALEFAPDGLRDTIAATVQNAKATALAHLERAYIKRDINADLFELIAGMKPSISQPWGEPLKINQYTKFARNALFGNEA